MGGGSAATDPWLDERADEAADVTLAGLNRIREVAAAGERTQRRFALPGYVLNVEGLGAAVTDHHCLAFAHLESAAAGSGPVLNWTIGDTTLVPGVIRAPPPPGPLHPFGSLHRNASNRVLIERRPGHITLFDSASLSFHTLVDGVGSIDTDLMAKPLLRFLLHLMLRQGVVLCHAALIGGETSGLLVAGWGGAGKSTIAASAVTDGAGFCSDDFVALRWEGDELVGACLYSTLMLHEDQLARFPDLASGSMRMRADTFPKHLVSVAQARQNQVRRELRVDGVATPRIVARPNSRLTSGSISEALRAVGPSSVIASPWREAERVAFLFDHVGRLPPYTYESGSDFSAISRPLRDRYGL